MANMTSAWGLVEGDLEVVLERLLDDLAVELDASVSAWRT